MEPRLDQVIYWREGRQVIVQVEFFDLLGALRKEQFRYAGMEFRAGLEACARSLKRRGIKGPCRVRKKQGGSLATDAALQKRFLGALES